MHQKKNNKIKNLPEKIYLQIGDDEPLEDWNDLPTGAEITWCVDKIFDNDIVYTLDKRRLKKEKKMNRYPDILRGFPAEPDIKMINDLCEDYWSWNLGWNRGDFNLIYKHGKTKLKLYYSDDFYMKLSEDLYYPLVEKLSSWKKVPLVFTATTGINFILELEKKNE